MGHIKRLEGLSYNLEAIRQVKVEDDVVFTACKLM